MTLWVAFLRAVNLGHRQPDRRHSPGLDKFDRQLEKGAVATMRNWNTIPKVLN